MWTFLGGCNGRRLTWKLRNQAIDLSGSAIAVAVIDCIFAVLSVVKSNKKKVWTMRQWLAVMACLLLLAATAFAQNLPDRQVGIGAAIGTDASGVTVAYALSRQFHLGALMGLEVGSQEGNSDVNIAFAPYGKYIFSRLAESVVLYGMGQFLIGSSSVGRGGINGGNWTDASIGLGLGLEALLAKAAVALYTQTLLFHAHFGDVTGFYFGPGQFRFGIEIFLPR